VHFFYIFTDWWRQIQRHWLKKSAMPLCAQSVYVAPFWWFQWLSGEILPHFDPKTFVLVKKNGQVRLFSLCLYAGLFKNINLKFLECFYFLLKQVWNISLISIQSVHLYFYYHYIFKTFISIVGYQSQIYIMLRSFLF
jgi:hypothetical protein